MGFKNLPIRRMAKILQRTFMDVCTVNIYRTSKEFDSITGADTQKVDFDNPVETSIQAYLSSHPWFVQDHDSRDETMNKRANYSLHVPPTTDIRQDDVLLVEQANGIRRLFVCSRVAYYPSHSRMTLFEWDYRVQNEDLTGFVTVPDWGLTR